MGLPVNNFTFWSYLENENKESWQSELQKIQKNFSLFGYIIHDPESKDGFGEFLGERFDQMSRMTGTDFLFTAFVNPPENFDNSYEFEPGYYYLANQIFNSNNILKSDLSSFYAISISEYLGINTVSLPYIIITDDPTKNRFYFIELNRRNFFEVMSDLTFVAEKIKTSKRQSKKDSLSQDLKYEEFPSVDQIEIDSHRLESAPLEPTDNYFEFLRKSVKTPSDFTQFLEHPFYEVKLKVSLAKALLKISYKLQKFALNQVRVKNMLLAKDWEEKIIKELKDIQKIEFQGAQIIYDYLKGTDGSLFKADLLKNKETLLRALLELQGEEFEHFKNSIEPDTLSILLDGALLNSLYHEDVFSDASPFILPFGKAFEKEMTYSLVHWIRENLTIDLPDFFFKYQPEKEAILQKGRAYFDYNQLKPNTTVWQPPMIGGQVNGLELLSKGKSIQPFKDPKELKLFLKLGNKVMGIRNQASHLGQEGAASLRAIIHAWRTLWNDGYLEQFNGLKKKYRKV